MRQQVEQARAAEAAGDWVAALATWTRRPRRRRTPPEAGAACAAVARRSSGRRHRATRDSETRPASPKQPSAETTEYRDALALYAAGDLPGAVAKLRAVQKLDPDNRAAASCSPRRAPNAAALSEDRTRVRELYLRGMSYFHRQRVRCSDRRVDEDPRPRSGNTSVYQNIKEAQARSSALRK
jgi:hypothetical protein